MVLILVMALNLCYTIACQGETLHDISFTCLSECIMKKVINEKVKNVSFYTVNKNGVKTLLKSSDISYLYFDWKKIFGTAEPEIGHDYAITKTLLKELKKRWRERS